MHIGKYIAPLLLLLAVAVIQPAEAQSKSKKQLEKDDLADNMKDQLSAMEKALEMDKETFLRLKKDEIIPFIEREIAIRYWFQEGGVEVDIRYDDALRKALSSPLI